MKYLYINSRLHPLSLVASANQPREWIFSRGEPWLLLTPPRLKRLARHPGLQDGRVSDLLARVIRWHPHPEEFCRALNIEERPQPQPDAYPLAICQYCDGLHNPHPAEALEPCPKCRQKQAKQHPPAPGPLEDQRRDREMRQWLLENNPEAFDEGALSPHWRINKLRRLERDWENAINRILMGSPYRAVAKEFSCSVGLLHRKVHEHKQWHNN